MPRTREIISVPNVGHGNPATAQALVEQARFYPDLNVQYLVLSGTAKAARTFHEGMTQDPNKAQRYIGDSAKRTTLSSRVYAGASALELALRAGRAEDGAPTAWTVVQEHSLLGASPRLLRHLGITSVRLTTPDVYPKDSGLEAVHKHGPSARIFVWNTETQESLEAQGFPTALTAPYLAPYRQADGHSGHSVVAKTSGSGLPPAWRAGLLGAFEHVEGDWVFHTPETRYTDGTAAKKSGDTSIQQYYGDIGTDTRLLIGYPSELMGLAAGRNELGLPTWMLTYPPRGAHEKRNLEFGLDHGIVLGELALSHGPSLDDGRLRSIRLEDLPGAIHAAESEQPGWVPGQGVVGTVPFWEVARSLDLREAA